MLIKFSQFGFEKTTSNIAKPCRHVFFACIVLFPVQTKNLYPGTFGSSRQLIAAANAANVQCAGQQRVIIITRRPTLGHLSLYAKHFCVLCHGWAGLID